MARANYISKCWRGYYHRRGFHGQERKHSGDSIARRDDPGSQQRCGSWFDETGGEDRRLIALDEEGKMGTATLGKVEGLTTTRAPFIERAQQSGQLYIHQPYELYSAENHEAWRRLFAAQQPLWR